VVDLTRADIPLGARVVLVGVLATIRVIVIKHLFVLDRVVRFLSMFIFKNTINVHLKGIN
jgi:hypothetical protein